jgi:lysozyme
VATSNVVADISHHNGRIDFDLARRDGIVGVIQKATQGLGYMDPTYIDNRTRAKAAGLLWGAYHFGTGSDGVEQAIHFLEAADPVAEDLVVLDFEANAQGPSMTLAEAHAFVTHVQASLGRWPGLYSGHYVKGLLGSQADPILAKCWFWLSQYGPTPVVPPTWPTWTLWQYTDGGLGPEPHAVNGLGRCDRDMFNGDIAGLQRLWGV